MKDTLTEMKNKLQVINSSVGEAKNQNSVLEYKEAENTQSEQQKEKKNFNEGSVRSLGTTSSVPTFALRGCWEEKRESKKLETYLKK